MQLLSNKIVCTYVHLMWPFLNLFLKTTDADIESAAAEQEICYVNDVRFQRRRTQTVASAGNVND